MVSKGRKHRAVRAALLLSLAVVAADAVATTQYVFTYLPSAPGRDARDINDSGQVVGNYCPTVDRCDSYVYSGGVFTTFSPPNADMYGSSANKINNGGAIVGEYNPVGSTANPGFVRSGSTFRDVNIGTASTAVLGISNNGAISGSFSNDTSPLNGFQPNGFLQLTPGGTVIDFGVGSAVWGVNSFGQAVYNRTVISPGSAITSAYLYSNGTSTPIVIPGAYQIAGVDINDAGQIVGSYQTTRGGAFTGFVATNGSYGIITPQRGGSINLYGINDLGQVVGYEQYGNGNILNADPFIATLANLPDAIVDGSYTFNVQVISGAPIFIDPLVAVGYDYAIGAGDPDFQTVRLPVGIGDGLFTITLPDGSTFTVGGGELFDFTAHGYLAGLDHFSVGGIETSAGLDPANSNAFVTGLTFVADGFFTGTMTPRAVLLAVDEPATLMLLTLGLVGYGLAAKRRRTGMLAARERRAIRFDDARLRTAG